MTEIIGIASTRYWIAGTIGPEPGLVAVAQLDGLVGYCGDAEGTAAWPAELSARVYKGLFWQSGPRSPVRSSAWPPRDKVAPNGAVSA